MTVLILGINFQITTAQRSSPSPLFMRAEQDALPPLRRLLKGREVQVTRCILLAGILMIKSQHSSSPGCGAAWHETHRRYGGGSAQQACRHIGASQPVNRSAHLLISNTRGSTAQWRGREQNEARRRAGQAPVYGHGATQKYRGPTIRGPGSLGGGLAQPPTFRSRSAPRRCRPAGCRRSVELGGRPAAEQRWA